MKTEITKQQIEQILREGKIIKDSRNESKNRRAQMVDFQGFTYCIVKQGGEIISATKGIILGQFFLSN